MAIFFSRSIRNVSEEFISEIQPSRNKTYLGHKYFELEQDEGIIVEDLSQAETRLAYNTNILCWYKMNEVFS